MNNTITSMIEVYAHLKEQCFIASKSNIAFKVSITKLKEFFNLGESNTALLSCLFIAYFFNNEVPVSLSLLSEKLETNPLRLLAFKQNFDALEDKGLIISDQPTDNFSLSKFYRIPENVIKAVAKEDASLLKVENRPKDYNLTYPEDITEKELFYPEEIKNDIEELFTYFEKEEFSQIQKRLIQRNMPKGVCLMFHGASGSGKTETVYQLAKRTNRPLYHVDIGSIISPWIGGTENNVALIFEKYEKLCSRARKHGENIPILLFNEADALFGSRLENPRQGCEVSENHIQSILLDCLEKQTGILIVTTNLAGNFDKAFERRFLFKLKFEKPNLEIKTKIWKNKINWLEAKTAEYFAQSYAFSGAEIENIARKATMQEILTGNKSSVAEIEDFCKKEKIELNNQRMIGFK